MELALYGTESSLPLSQEPSSGPYPEQTDPVHTTEYYQKRLSTNLILRASVLVK
jgi:hypothetical protein